MKSMKKLIVAVLAVVAAMALCVPALAFAADEQPSIEIHASNSDAHSITTTYTYYEIFKADIGSLGAINQATGELVDGAALGKVAYYIPHTEAGDDLKNAIVAKDSPDDLDKQIFKFTLSADQSRWVVALKDGRDPAATAADITDLLSDASIVGEALAHNTFTMSGGVAKAENLDPGYYIVTSSLGTNVAVQTLGNVVINEKNDYIVDEKVVETASVTIGESATYYIKVYLPATIDTTKLVTVHDEMEDALSFNDDLQVSVSATNPATADYKNLTYVDLDTDVYDVKTTGLSDDCDFHIDITTTNLAGNYLVFRFSAELLADADPDQDGFVNKEWTTYPGYETVPSTPKVWTYQFDVLKTDGTDKLDGAIFELRKTETGAGMLFVLESPGVYKKADENSTGTTANLVINSFTLDGATKIQGLGAGTYYLVETKAADGGYNLLAHPIIVTIADDGTISATFNNASIGTSVQGRFTIEVINEAGTQLPSTGGMGTTILYVVGGIMIAVAVVFLVRRRFASKKSESEDLM